MVRVVKPTEYLDTQLTKVFLGGSIEMGSAEEWQERLAKEFDDVNDVVFFNPRRDDWDSSWKQDPTPGTQFHGQVKWELDCQEDSDIYVYYFDPKTKSPITLLELGLFGTNTDTIVCCPPDYFRYGNVAIVCDRYDITLVHTFDELVTELRKLIA